MGLVRLREEEWLQPNPDLAGRRKGFAEWPEGVQITPQSDAPGRELAAMLGVPIAFDQAALPQVAHHTHEDLCLLTQSTSGEPYRLIGAAVAWPTDWHPKDKLGLTLRALHAPITGYEEQLATGVDRFMSTLRPGLIFGRCNWFIAPTPERRWLAEGDAQDQFGHVTPENAGETLFVRTERQTLRRLPETGAILFTIGVYVEPLANLTAENARKLSQAVQTLIDGEGDRRGALSYAAALNEFAHQKVPTC